MENMKFRVKYGTKPQQNMGLNSQVRPLCDTYKGQWRALFCQGSSELSLAGSSFESMNDQQKCSHVLRGLENVLV